jgi:hypothetical protein
MRAIGARFDDLAATIGVGAPDLQRLLREVVRILDHLLPPRRGASHAELPPEFYKYPPV